MSAEALLPPALEIPEDSSPRSSGGDGESNRKAGNIIKVSLGVALSWWGFGVYTVISTASLAVLASLVDATIDLAAQGVLLGANTLAESNGTEKAFPAGVSRLEPVGVIVCSVLMALASGAVIYDSVDTLLHGRTDMHFTNEASAMLSVVVCVKIAVWQVAKRQYEKTKNVSLEALALDNFNDILSNASALAFASVTRIRGDLWWMDPVGGVLISIYIIRSWCLTAFEQINMLVGREAHPEFLSTVREIAEAHHPDAAVDVVRAYHFGPKFLVEIELVMDPKTPLEISHDVGMLLQDQIEHMEECERCFVHIDYAHRGDIDHDKYVPIHNKTSTPPATQSGKAVVPA